MKLSPNAIFSQRLTWCAIDGAGSLCFLLFWWIPRSQISWDLTNSITNEFRPFASPYTHRTPTVHPPFHTIPHRTHVFLRLKNVKSGGVKSKRSKFVRKTLNILLKSSKNPILKRSLKSPFWDLKKIFYQNLFKSSWYLKKILGRSC